MIGWTHPSALWWLILVAGPVVVHLLRRHRAERVPFPSVRFVRPAETAAVRLRTPSDLWLLLLRAGAIALAVCAAAGPVVLTAGRLSQWNSLTARAIVVDTSDSMRTPGADGVNAERRAAEAADAEARASAHSVRIETPSLTDGLRRAAAWLVSAPPARREVVVISDFQRGALHAGALDAVGANVGRRLVSVGRPVESRSIAGASLLFAGHDAHAGVGEGASSASGTIRAQTIDLTSEATSVEVGPPAPADATGLRFIGAENAAAAIDRMLRAAAGAGAAAPARDQPIAVRFDAGGATSAPLLVSRIQRGWMLDMILHVMNDPVVASTRPRSASALGSAAEAAWTVVIRDEDAAVLVRAAALGRELLLDVGAPADGLFAAAVVRSALNGTARTPATSERETAVTPAPILASWQRPAAPVGSEVWRNSSTTDARWFWLLALALLGAEQWLRSRPRVARRTEDVRAAA